MREFFRLTGAVTGTVGNVLHIWFEPYTKPALSGVLVSVGFSLLIIANLISYWMERKTKTNA